MDEQQIAVDGPRIAFTQSEGDGRAVIHAARQETPGAFTARPGQFIADRT